jgi:hypothetical protein
MISFTSLGRKIKARQKELAKAKKVRKESKSKPIRKKSSARWNGEGLDDPLDDLFR